jgi:hypothetical protein
VVQLAVSLSSAMCTIHYPARMLNCCVWTMKGLLEKIFCLLRDGNHEDEAMLMILNSSHCIISKKQLHQLRGGVGSDPADAVRPSIMIGYTASALSTTLS